VTLSASEIGLLTGIMQTAGTIYAIVFVIYTLQAQHYAAKKPLVRARDGMKFAFAAHRVWVTGMATFWTLVVCVVALAFDSESWVLLSIVTFFVGLAMIAWSIRSEVLTSVDSGLAHYLLGQALPDIVAEMKVAQPLTPAQREELVGLMMEEEAVYAPALRIIRDEVRHWARSWIKRKIWGDAKAKRVAAGIVDDSPTPPQVPRNG